jgi:hypothetical protein
MIKTVIDSLVALLSNAGLDARIQYPPNGLDKHKGCIICVGVKNSKRTSSGNGEYLGIGTDPVTLDTHELYGFRIELSFALDIFAPYGENFGAPACLDCFSVISSALSNAPSGLMMKALSCGDVKPHKDSEMLCCSAKLDCEAYLLSVPQGEPPEFTSFILKGVLK